MKYNQKQQYGRQVDRTEQFMIGFIFKTFTLFEIVIIMLSNVILIPDF